MVILMESTSEENVRKKPRLDNPEQNAPGEVNHGQRPEYPEHENILDHLRRHVARTPASVALVVPEGEFGDNIRLEVSYDEMWAIIVQAGKELTKAKAQTGTKWVIVVLPQGIQQVCAVWGILHAGCGYVPIDSETQEPRLRMLFEEIQPSVAVGEAGITPLSTVATESQIPLGTFPHGVRRGLVINCAAQSHEYALVNPKPDDIALLLLSSGSTGKPKGIIYDHRWLVGCAYFVAKDHFELNAQSRCLLRCSYVWSVSLYDFFPVNMVGGQLIIPPRGGHMNVQYMSETIARECIHALVIQPTLLNLLLDEHQNSTSYPLRSLRHVCSSGEKLFTSTAYTFVNTSGLNAKLWNMYGATEAGCTYFVVASGEANKLSAFPDGVPAGIPQSYVDVWVMTTTDDPLHPLRPVPVGELGEIVFGGGGKGFLARGYWRNEDLTKEKFLHTTDYGIVYRTGDAGCWRDGVLLVCGRLDRQVKVRGVRIQPEDIEGCLKKYVDGTGNMPIKACIVVPSTQEPIELTAFLQTGEGLPINVSAVFSHLQQELGRVYVPKNIVHLPEGLPRTASGKPDVNALRHMALNREGVSGKPDGDEPVEHTAGNVILGDPYENGATLAWQIDLRSQLWKFCHDHKYKNEPLFPGSGYLSLASEACQHLWPHWELHDIKFSNPLPLIPPRPLQVSATVVGTTASIAITSTASANNSTVHCTCLGVKGAEQPAPKAKEHHSNGSNGMRHARSVSQLYDELADGGFDYGPQFQALQSLFLSGDVAGGKVLHRHQSPFLIDPVDVDACFQLSPLISPLGFQGAPTAIKRLVKFGQCTPSAECLDVTMAMGKDGIDFHVASGDSAVCLIEGLELQAFDSLAPEVRMVVQSNYVTSTAKVRAPRVVAVGSSATEHAKNLAKVIGATQVCTWLLNEPLEEVPSTSVAIVVNGNDAAEQAGAFERLLPILGFQLPYGGRIWLVILGEGHAWACLGRAWAIKHPHLLISILHVGEIGPSCEALLDIEAPPYLQENRSWHLESATVATTEENVARTRFAGVPLDGPIIVLAASEAEEPLAQAVMRELRSRTAAEVTLALPGHAVASKAPMAVFFCAISSTLVADFEPVCASAKHCVTICSMAAVLPSPHSGKAHSSALAAAASQRRVKSGHSSWIFFAPPLMEGLWFEPPAPVGFHRCPLATFISAFADAPACNSIAGIPDHLPKHWSGMLNKESSASRSRSELREFLSSELATIANTESQNMDESKTLEELGVGSLASLRLSQRLRRFLGKDFSAFALQGNPTVAGLLDMLTTNESRAKADQIKRDKILCLHGFRTSSVVLQQQLAPLVPIVERLGYELVVPDAPHKSKGAAQFAEGLDQDDSYGWWLYEGDNDSHDSRPIGLEKSEEYIKRFQPVVGIIGFSQGGAMAAHVANSLQAKWALLFSPVYVPGHAAECDCPTLVAYDPTEEVYPATEKLLQELPSTTQQLKHNFGHRLPPASDWYEDVASFLVKHRP